MHLAFFFCFVVTKNLKYVSKIYLYVIMKVLLCYTAHNWILKVWRIDDLIGYLLESTLNRTPFYICATVCHVTPLH